MRRLNSYGDFLLESKINLLLESELSFSDKFLSIVDDIDDNYIADVLIHQFKRESDIDTKVNFIDCSKSNDRLTFLADVKGQKFLSDREDPFDVKGRNEVKVGKLVRKLLDAIKNSFKKLSYTDQDVEDFVNKYKSSFDKTNGKMDRFRVVSGDEIKKWYYVDNYLSLDGELGSSCMRYGRCQDYLDIYTKNDNVKLLVLFSDEVEEFVDEDTGELIKIPVDKVIGRSIIWGDCSITENEDGIVSLSNNTFNGEKLEYTESFMDRVYTIKDSDKHLFISYAKKNGWWYKETQDSDEQTYLYGPRDNYSDSNPRTIVSSLQTKDLSSYPYTDTLKYYLWKNGYITNDVESARDSGKYIIELESTNGGYDCMECGGEGRIDCDSCSGGEVDCSQCVGNGEIECGQCEGFGNVSCTQCKGNGEETCPECKGNGEINGETCTHCDGDNRITCQECSGDGEMNCPKCSGSTVLICPECDGSSTFMCEECNGNGSNECETCGGNGYWIS